MQLVLLDVMRSLGTAVSHSLMEQ